jgi:phage gp16-like protein
MKTWEEAVSHLRQLAKESEDFTMRIHELASAIQRMERDKTRHDPTCKAYGNYQPPYEDCTCKVENK